MEAVRRALRRSLGRRFRLLLEYAAVGGVGGGQHPSALTEGTSARRKTRAREQRDSSTGAGWVGGTRGTALRGSALRTFPLSPPSPVGNGSGRARALVEAGAEVRAQAGMDAGAAVQAVAARATVTRRGVGRPRTRIDPDAGTEARVRVARATDPRRPGGGVGHPRAGDDPCTPDEVGGERASHTPRLRRPYFMTYSVPLHGNSQL